jgi:hypothetical protein
MSSRRSGASSSQSVHWSPGTLLTVTPVQRFNLELLEPAPEASLGFESESASDHEAHLGDTRVYDELEARALQHGETGGCGR